MELEAFALVLGAVSVIYALTFYKSAISDVIESRQRLHDNESSAERGVEVCMSMQEYRRIESLAADHGDKDLSRILLSIRTRKRRIGSS